MKTVLWPPCEMTSSESRRLSFVKGSGCLWLRTTCLTSLRCPLSKVGASTVHCHSSNDLMEEGPQDSKHLNATGELLLRPNPNRREPGRGTLQRGSSSSATPSAIKASICSTLLAITSKANVFLNERLPQIVCVSLSRLEDPSCLSSRQRRNSWPTTSSLMSVVNVLFAKNPFSLR